MRLGYILGAIWGLLVLAGIYAIVDRTQRQPDLALRATRLLPANHILAPGDLVLAGPARFTREDIPDQSLVDPATLGIVPTYDKDTEPRLFPFASSALPETIQEPGPVCLQADGKQDLPRAPLLASMCSVEGAGCFGVVALAAADLATLAKLPAKTAVSLGPCK